MKIKITKTVAFLMAIALCVAFASVSVFADNAVLKSVGGVVELDGTNKNTVSVSISASTDMVLQLIQGVFSTTEKEGTNYLKLIDISSDQIVFDGVNYAYDVNTGELVWMDDSYAGLSFEQDAPVLVATYEVAANTPVGTYTVEFTNEVIADGDWNEYYDHFTFTIEVKEAAPACEHEYMNGCSTICIHCGEERPAPAHNVIHVEAKESDCFNDGNLEYWYCSECEQYWLDEELTMNTIKDVVIIRTTGHSKVEADNGNGTHRIECCVCSALLEDNIPHDFTSGEADNTCVCGKIYCDHGKLVYEVNQDYGHFVKCALCGEEIGYESHVGEYHIGHIDLGQIMIAMGCKYCGYYPVYVWYSNPEVSTQPGTCMSPAVTTYVFNIEDLPLYAKGENLGDAVYAPEKDGETDLNYHVNEDNWTLVITVIGELDFNNHVSSEVSYQNITDEQHTVYHPCCEATETVDHTFDETTHMCVCGKVETYTLTIEVLATGETVELTVPYGANILEVLEKAAAEDKIPAIDDVIRIENKYENGEATISGYSYCVDGGKWIYDLEGLTMPAADFKVDQDCDYIGWYYNYDEDDVYVGAEYEDETGWLTPGWHYIEEDYDDVEGGAWYYFYEVTIEYTDGEYTGNIRAEGLTRATYPTEPINGKTYAPNAEDVAYWEAHKDTSKYSDATSAVFYFDENGKFVQYTGVEGKSYFIDGMAPWHVGFVEIDGEYYYFAGDKDNGGNVMATGNIYVTRNNTDLEVVMGGIYTFAADGKLCKYNGVTEINGVLYYYDNYRLATDAGMIKNGEGFSYVRSSAEKAGQLVVDRKYWVSKGNGLLAEGMYEFDENGLIVMENKLEGIVEVDGVYYYYEAGVKQIGAGVVALTDENGETYYIYVRSDGSLATGKYWPTTRNGLLERGEYDWGTDGKYYPGK